MGYIKNYLFESSLHGLHFIIDGRLHWSEKLYWIICVIFSCIASLLMTISAINQYETQKVSFSIDTYYLPWKTNFPSIVICEHKKNLQAANDLLFGGSVTIPLLENFVYYDGIITREDECKIGSPGRNSCLLGNYSAYTNKYRSMCSELINFCRYNNVLFPCCDEFLNITGFYGSCFAFNSLVSGKYQDQDTLPFKISHYIPGNLSFNLLHPHVLVFALSQDAIPTRDSRPILSGNEEITGEFNLFKIFLSVKASITENSGRLLNIANRGCRFYDENNLVHWKIYSKSTCENECLVNIQKEHCGCVVHTLLDGKYECNFDGLLCTQNSTLLEMSKNCSCETSCFDMDVTNIGTTKRVIKNKSLQSGTFRMEFQVQPPTIRYMRSVVKDSLSMLVSVGGIAGLCVGASFLSLVEILYYLIIRPIGDKARKKMHYDFYTDLVSEYLN